MDFIYTLMDIGLVPLIVVGIVIVLLVKGLGFGKNNSGSNNNNTPPQNPPSPPAS